jgi:acetolactate synthase I/II/III large subunit
VKCYEAMADVFRDEGVEVVFAVMGDANYLFLAACEERAIQVVWTRHENAALAMADGYASASGRVGVCSVTYGPGLTSAVTSLFNAHRRRVPIVLFAGDTPQGHTINTVDHESLVACTGALWQPVRESGTAVEDARDAFRRARTEKAPVVLNALKDLQDEDILGGGDELRPSSPPPSLEDRPGPDPASVERFARRLMDAARPVVVVGRGGLEAPTRDAIVRLGDRIGAVFATTLLAKGAFAGHPFDAGIIGLHSTEALKDTLAACDCVVVLGGGRDVASLAYLFPQAEVVNVDVAPQAAGGRTRYDPARTAAALDLWLANRQFTQTGLRSPDLAARLGDSDVPADPSIAEGECDPRAVVREVDVLLPADTHVVVGGGHFTDFVVAGMTRPKQVPYLFSAALDLGGAIGQGLPVAIGAAFALDGARVALFEGDASLMMYVGELHTASRYGLDLLVVVMNDDGLGAEYHKLGSMGMDPASALMHNPDLAGVSCALGVPAVTVTHVSQLEDAVQRYRDEPGPFLINAVISRRVVSDMFKRLHFEVFTGED